MMPHRHDRIARQPFGRHRDRTLDRVLADTRFHALVAERNRLGAADVDAYESHARIAAPDWCGVGTLPG